jgi:hypothetical protein
MAAINWTFNCKIQLKMVVTVHGNWHRYSSKGTLGEYEEMPCDILLC